MMIMNKNLQHSIGILAGCLVLLCGLVDWHGHQKSRTHRQLGFVSETSRTATTTTSTITRWLLLQPESNDNPVASRNITNDKQCNDYLKKFLNGTTDSNDECTAMSNAWTGALCREEKGGEDIIVSLFGNVRGDGDNKNNDTITDDQPFDDPFENWECCDIISSFYEKNCQDRGLDAKRLFGIVLVLLVCNLMKSLLRIGGLQWIPDAGVCILVGAVVGGFLRVFRPQVVSQYMSFDNDLFLQILLPPIIFEAAISINKRAFRRDLFPILTFAIIGTAVSAVGIGLITYYLSDWGGVGLPFLDSLLFGALMSSIDPVATLSILSSVGVRQTDTLYTMVFGESLLNDGVAIVLFDSLVRHMGDRDVVDNATVKDTLVHFTIISIGSIFVGLLCGTLCNFYFWALQGQHTAVAEVAMFFTWANLPFYLADAYGFSGIISIMVMGFMMDYYIIGGARRQQQQQQQNPEDYGGYSPMTGSPLEPITHRPHGFKAWTMWAWRKAFSGKGHVSEESQKHVGFVAEVIASLMETAIFAYLGLFLFNDKDGNFELMGTGVFACVSSRAAMVIVLCALINVGVYFDLERNLGLLWASLRGRDRSSSFYTLDDIDNMSSSKYLDPRTQFILFTAGVRGAVSYALVQNIPVYDAVTKQGSHFKGELRAMTSATIVGLLFVFGALTYYAVDRPNRTMEYTEYNRALSETLVQHQDPYAPPHSDRQVSGGEHELQFNESTYDVHEQQHQPMFPEPQRFS